MKRVTKKGREKKKKDDREVVVLTKACIRFPIKVCISKALANLA